jgi:hypothetical protein
MISVSSVVGFYCGNTIVPLVLLPSFLANAVDFGARCTFPTSSTLPIATSVNAPGGPVNRAVS